jgi:hypothetical protein
MPIAGMVVVATNYLMLLHFTETVLFPFVSDVMASFTHENFY